MKYLSNLPQRYAKLGDVSPWSVSKLICSFVLHSFIFTRLLKESFVQTTPRENIGSLLLYSCPLSFFFEVRIILLIPFCCSFQAINAEPHMALCPRCGWLSLNLSKCRRCCFVLPGNVKKIPGSKYMKPPAQSTIVPIQNDAVIPVKRQSVPATQVSH